MLKKHMRLCNHHGPVLVGRKAMAKVMEVKIHILFKKNFFIFILESWFSYW